MQNFGSQNNIGRTNILTELAMGNSELGEAFALILNDMVTQSGITNPNAECFEVVPDSWRTLAKKENKTSQDIQKLDTILKEELDCLAQSYLLFISKTVKNQTGKIDYSQYESFMLKYRFGKYDVMNKPEYLNKVKIQIRNAFNKLSAHGETSGDNLIDKHDMAAYIYALATRVKRGDDGKSFKGFEINGIITPEEYAVNERNLFEAEDNLVSLKLRVAYKVLNNKL